MYSVTTNAFHPPPHAVILPVTKDGITAGRISFFHLLILVKLCIFDVSIRSEGIAIIPPIRLKSRYHCMPVIVKIIDVNWRPPGKSIVARIIIGNIAVAGIAARTWIINIFVLKFLLLLAITAAKGKVQATLRAYARKRRIKEDPKAIGITLNSCINETSRMIFSDISDKIGI